MDEKRSLEVPLGDEGRPDALDDKEKHELDPELADTVVEGGVMRHGVRLHPQPTTDPLDPLNWTSVRKHSILAVVMWK